MLLVLAGRGSGPHGASLTSTLPPVWQLLGTLHGDLARSAAPATTPGAVCDVSARGEVSVAYAALNFAFDNGGSLIALWCILVS